jgi:hypothetical protein
MIVKVKKAYTHFYFYYDFDDKSRCGPQGQLYVWDLATRWDSN